jgi:hypothetical protein
VEVKRSCLFVVIAAILIGLLLSGLNDTAISAADTVTPDNEAGGTIGEASNSSASTTITITVYTGYDE